MPLSPLSSQLIAIKAPPGPTLVVAGPGAGKTFCLIGRVNHLIAELGFAPERILAVTFTNRAAEEIAHRLRTELSSPLSGFPERGPGGEDVKRGTLHALCLEILRDHAAAAGLKQGFGVADEQYQRTILARLGVPPRRRGAVLTMFSRKRLASSPLSAFAERGTGGEAAFAERGTGGEAQRPGEPDVRSSDNRLYDDYLTFLARRNVLDFDGLIAETLSLFERRPEIAATVAARWDYLLVDEFQDLNSAQYEILKHLAATHRNFFAVGDDEQSIFSWTGADSLILKRFSDDFATAPVILDHNHRNSRQIFETARRVLAENPQIFAKQLTADRASDHEVVARNFPDETAEAAWLIEDLEADRAAAGLGWGDYAILYRKHRVAEFLEAKLVGAGIPCRLARGRSLADDEVVGWVIGALRVLRDPADQVAVEAFAEIVFQEHLLEEVRAYGEGGELDFLNRVRALARARRGKDDPDTKRLWRFVYFVENLASLPHQFATLPLLVNHLLSRSVGPYRNVLEDRHDELSDPAELPEAVALAERLQRALDTEADVTIEPMGGLEIALRGMLIAAGFRHLPIAPSAPSAPFHVAASALTVFKALQLIQSREIGALVQEFVAFDLETTDNEVDSCDIIEIGAARVRDGVVVGEFHALVRPSQPIAPGATKQHGYSDADVAGAPTLAEVWRGFRDFVGDDLLVAHNGQYFDVPVLRRLAAGWDGLDTLVFYDTLPLAKSLSPEAASLQSLATRFGIDTGRAHHALDDAITLAHVFMRLERERQVRARKSVFTRGLEWLGLALALEHDAAPSEERRMLFDLIRRWTLRSKDCLETYAQERERTRVVSPTPEEVIDRLGGQELMIKLRAEPDPAQKYPAAVARLEALMDAPSSSPLSGSSPPVPLSLRERGDEGRVTLAQALDRLLERVALSTSDGVEVSPDRVNLLTLHSTKGLEFSRVYIVGVEDFQMPGYYATVDNRGDEIQEGRRLLYVGMTRAKDRLVLTRVDQRFGRDAGGSMFLDEMQLEPHLAL